MAHWNIDSKRLQDRLTIAFAILFVAFAVGSFFNRGPKFHGKPAKYWARELIRGRDQQVIAAHALFQLGPETSVPVLIQALQAQGPPVYRNIWPKLPGFLQTRLPNPFADLNNRDRAAWVLGGFGMAAQPAVPYLITSLQSSNVQLKCAAAVALGAIGPEARTAIPPLEAMAKDTSTYISGIALTALNKIVQRNSTDFLPGK
jgi:HEAT repeat protein